LRGQENTGVAGEFKSAEDVFLNTLQHVFYVRRTAWMFLHALEAFFNETFSLGDGEEGKGEKTHIKNS